MNAACSYSIIRFRPFAETGEFANIGVVAVQSLTGEVAYRLTPHRVRRISQFFPEAGRGLLAAVIAYLKDELDRVTREAMRLGNGKSLLQYLTSPRESAVVFSELRTAMIDRDLEQTVDSLFASYVGRQFATAEYREVILARDIGRALRQRNIRSFREVRVDDDLAPITFQLANEDDGLRVIKPLAFVQHSTAGILEHAAQWTWRINRLVEHGKLRPENLLLPIDDITDEDEPPLVAEARTEAVSYLDRTGAKILRGSDIEPIAAFAKLTDLRRDLYQFDAP